MKPREKMLVSGVESLSDNELLCIILGTGSKNNSVYNVSTNLLKYINEINSLSSISVKELSKIEGIGIVKASIIIASIELGKRVLSKNIELGIKLNNSELIFNAFKYIFKNNRQEKFIAIYLDNQKRLISYKILFIGSVNKTIVDAKEVFNEAIKVCASNIIIMHNHPSGNLTPSNDDLITTNNLVSGGKMLNILVIDHLITDGNTYFSFWENNLICK